MHPSALALENMFDRVDKKSVFLSLQEPCLDIHTITLVQRQQCAFIPFITRYAAEHAPGKSFNKLIAMATGSLSDGYGRWVQALKRTTVRWGSCV